MKKISCLFLVLLIILCGCSANGSDYNDAVDLSYERICELNDFKCYVSYLEQKITIEGEEAKELYKIVSESNEGIEHSPSSSQNDYIYLVFYNSTYNYPSADETTEFYLVAAPVDVQSRAITETRYQSTSDASIIIRADEYNTLTDDQKKNYTAFDVIIRQDILEFVVNGSARPLPERDQFNYEKGKIYKYVLPIKRLAQPYESDILDLESYGGRTTTDGKSTHQVDEIIKFYKSASGEKKNWVEATPTKININGQDVLGYVLGNPDGTLGAVTITCFLKDLFNALPVGFYLSSWDGSPAELGIGDIKLWIPNYNTTSSESTEEISDRVGTNDEYTVTRSVRSTHKVDYTNLESRGNSIRMKDSGGALGSIAYYLLGGDENFALNGDLLLAFAPGLGSKIPFSNLLYCCCVINNLSATCF